MAKGNKVFDTEFSGFNKKQVNEYIEKLVSQYQQSLSEKAKECDELRAKNEQLASKLNELSTAYIQAQEEKTKIADVLINAENTAKNIIAKAQEESAKERERLSIQADEKRMLIVDLNKIIRDMKLEVEEMIENAKSSLDNAVNQIKERMDAEKEQIIRRIEEINAKYAEKEEVEEEAKED
ncbi:MAG TPA: hypothetical protein PLI11_00220 [Clostridia bacterium]|jgi:cell division initiation protein|nr:hypothetical protein [Clostridiaceae bacterium]HPZ51324.1 hypothetical protein [Clostridia bacterium]